MRVGHPFLSDARRSGVLLVSRYNGLPGYDQWKTRSDLDDAPDADLRCCGNCHYGLSLNDDDEWVCERCDVPEEDEAADRGDWKFHQERDQ
jgi:hypothetical protein